MEKLRRLIVEDSEVQRYALKDLLESDKEIEIVGMSDNGKEAIALVATLKPDFITTDLQMPGMDGLQATRKILKSHSIPIFVVSASENDEIVFKALSLGANEVISKADISSDNADHLIKRIKNVLK